MSDDRLSEWLAEEARVRERMRAGGAGAGVARREAIEGKPGIALFEGIFAGTLPSPMICETLDFLTIRVEPGFAVFQGRPGRKHYNPLGVVHGGWFSTLLDSALGCAVHAALPAGKAYTTLELKVNMIRALTDRTPVVRAEGRVIHLGGQTAIAEGRLVGPDGKLYGHATTTCLVFELKPPPDHSVGRNPSTDR